MKAYTIGLAHQLFREEIGSLENVVLADLLILSTNPYKLIDPIKLDTDVQVLET